MSFSSAKLFCEIAECRSMSKAASKIGITQPAASQRLKILEKQMGVRLVDRSVRPLSLTQAGVAYLSHVEKALQHLSRAEDSAREYATSGNI